MFGGYIAEISDHAENEFIAKEIGLRGFDTAWLGGSDIFHEGVWQWKASSLQIYVPDLWEEGEPDNHGQVENCLEIKEFTGRWNDKDCNHQNFFVCEKRLHASITQASF